MRCAVQKSPTDVHKMFLAFCVFCRLDSARSSGVNCVVSNALRRPSDELDHRSDRKSSACGQELTPEETSLDFFVPTRAPTWLTKLNFKPFRPMFELIFGFHEIVERESIRATEHIPSCIICVPETHPRMFIATYVWRCGTCHPKCNRSVNFVLDGQTASPEWCASMPQYPQ